MKAKTQMGRPGTSCPVAGCKASIPEHHAMCPEHWGQVPEDAQKRLWKAAKAVTSTLSSVPAQGEWKSALEAAVAQIQPVEGGRGKVL